MRLVGVFGAVILAMVAFHPNMALAKDGGGHGGGGGSGGSHASTMSQPSGNYHSGSGMGQWQGEHHGTWDQGHGDWDHSHGYWYGGSWYPWYGYGYRRWYPGYGYGYGDYGYSGYPSESYSVSRPIENFSGGPIRITNPPNSGVTLNYTLNGTPYSIAPGSAQTFSEDRSWVIDFNRGGNGGFAQYQLHVGVYSFAATDHGWELYRQPDTQMGSGAPGGPANNPPPPAPQPAANPPGPQP